MVSIELTQEQLNKLCEKQEDKIAELKSKIQRMRNIMGAHSLGDVKKEEGGYTAIDTTP